MLIPIGSAFQLQESNALIFRPESGAMWDPSVFYHDGQYHAFMMYNMDEKKGLGSRHCLYISSADGVHWKDEIVVLAERDSKANFFKCMVARCGDRFILDHGVLFPGDKAQDTLRFYESTDLRTWDYLSSNSPDVRWYKDGRDGRWDHMYILPKTEGKPDAGYWGHVVSVKNSEPAGVGMMQSTDGREWEILPPADIEWGQHPDIDLEWGGCERIDGKYYLIGGRPYLFSQAYSMWTFHADSPRGPFRPDLGAFRLCGTSSGEWNGSITWLACWARGKDGELLISNYASMPSFGHSSPWLLPLRKAVVDTDGHLRMGWWQGNEAIKGESLALKTNTVTLNGKGSNDGYDVAYLDLKFDPKQGVVIEGTIKAEALPKKGQPTTLPSAGLILGDIAKDATAVQLGIGKAGERVTHIGSLLETDRTRAFQSQDITDGRCATVSGIDDGREHTFRLLCRLELFELYIDDLLMQTYLHKPDSGKIGFVACNAKAVFSELNAWRMSFSSETHDH